MSMGFGVFDSIMGFQEHEERLFISMLWSCFCMCEWKNVFKIGTLRLCLHVLGLRYEKCIVKGFAK